MNYGKIHNDIVKRASERTYDRKLHELHHIIPRHEDKNSEKCIPVTTKEHRILHLLRFKLFNKWQDKNAYLWMKNKTIEARKHICSNAGKIGGATTKSNNSGIFSSSWDRSKETTKRWEDGILSKDSFFHCDHYSAAGKKSHELKLGIHSDSYNRSAASEKQWELLSEDEYKERCAKNKKHSKLGGAKSKEMGTNFSSLSKESHAKIASKGGSAAGKIPMWTDGTMNKRSYDCPGDNFKLGITKKHRTTKQLTTYYFKEK